MVCQTRLQKARIQAQQGQVLSEKSAVSEVSKFSGKQRQSVKGTSKKGDRDKQVLAPAANSRTGNTNRANRIVTLETSRKTRGKNPSTTRGLRKKTQSTGNKSAKARLVPESPVPHPASQANVPIPSVEVDVHSSDSSDTRSETTVLDWYNLVDLEFWGPEFPFALNDQEAALIKVVLQHSDMYAKIVKERGELYSQLSRNRNVNMKPCRDGDDFNFHNLRSECPELPPDNLYLSHLWQCDIAKCQKEQEFLFQRTIMMSMIDRSRLFRTGQGNSWDWFDYSVERGWYCPPMPTRGLPLGSSSPSIARSDSKTGAVVSLPKPDLCVCFRADAVITADCLNGLSWPMRSMINIEGTGDLEEDRAFPFLIVEAKNSRVRSDDANALAQVWNAASQALHNMYEFFYEAGMENVFFEKVRFFTVVAVVSGCKFRMHRAVNKGSTNAGRIVPDYPLKFEYIEIGSYSSELYTWQAVVKMFENIIWGYGPILRKLLKRAGTKLERIMNTKGYNNYLINERDERYYRHGQGHTKELTKSQARAASEAGLSETPSKRNKLSELGTAEPTPSATASPQYIPRSSTNRLSIPYDGIISSDQSEEEENDDDDGAGGGDGDTQRRTFRNSLEEIQEVDSAAGLGQAIEDDDEDGRDMQSGPIHSFDLSSSQSSRRKEKNSPGSKIGRKRGAHMVHQGSSR